MPEPPHSIVPITPDARSAAETVDAPPTTELIVVENWDEVLKGIAPVEGK